MQNFELRGSTADETRLLVETTTGYSVPIPGHPILEQTGAEATVRLTDVKARYGFHIEEARVPAKQGLARSLVEEFAASRAREAPVATSVPAMLRPKTAIDGAEAAYPLAEIDDLTIEHVWIVIRPSRSGALVLRRTTTYRAADFMTIKWHHLRTAFSALHHWDADSPRSSSSVIWPESSIALPSATLDLTDDGWMEAKAKAADVGVVTSPQVKAIVEILTNVAEEDFPPSLPVPEIVSALHVRRLRELGRVGEVLTRNVAQCATALDFRAWAWQCAWALMHRESTSSD